MKTYGFFKLLPSILKLKLLNKFSNRILRKKKKVSKKQYEYFISLIKQYRYLGILPSHTIKFNIIK